VNDRMPPADRRESRGGATRRMITRVDGGGSGVATSVTVMTYSIRPA